MKLKCTISPLGVLVVSSWRLNPSTPSKGDCSKTVPFSFTAARIAVLGTTRLPTWVRVRVRVRVTVRVRVACDLDFLRCMDAFHRAGTIFNVSDGNSAILDIENDPRCRIVQLEGGVRLARLALADVVRDPADVGATVEDNLELASRSSDRDLTIVLHVAAVLERDFVQV